MSTEENKALIRRVFEEVWNAGNLDLVDELYHPDYVRHNAAGGVPLGPAGERRHRAAFRAAFPDLHITAEDIIAEGDRVAVRYRWHATHQGEFLGIPATGRRMTLSGIAIHRVVGGKIKELWVVGDELGLMRQLGAIPSDTGGA